MDPVASIIIPIHNEVEILRKNTESIMNYLSRELPDSEIILCENGSVDGTGQVAEKLAFEFEGVEFLSVPEPNLGEALRRGFIAAKSDKLVYYPIDLSADLGFIKLGTSLLDKFDIVVGSKRLSAGFDHRPLSRRITSKTFHGLVSWLFGVGIRDTTCVKAFRRGRILGLIDRIPTSSRIFETELLVEARREGFEIVEVPTMVEDRRRSRETLGRKIEGKLEDLLSARLNLISIYSGVLLFSAGIVSLIYLVLEKLLYSSQGGFLNPYSFLISILLILSGFQMVTFGLLANLILQIRRELTKAMKKD